MATYNRMTRQDAEAAGFTVDQSCYPWFGYTGPRFNPTQRVEVYTDLESELLRRQKPEEEFDYDDLLLAELKLGAQKISLAIVQDDFPGIAYKHLSSKVRHAVDKSFLLHGYLNHCSEYDLDETSLDVETPNPRVAVIYQRKFGRTGGLRFTSEARIVVTKDEAVFVTRVYQEGRTVSYDLKSSAQVVRAEDSATLLALVRKGLTEALQQVAHVAARESIPTVFALPV
jgi:hypothetical protein